MKQTRILLMMTLALVLSNAVVSCKKDPATVVEEAKVSKQTIENPELATKLKALGFQVEGGVITIDDKVMNTTSLDLSGAKISNLEGLELFPKLEEVNLADNNFGDTFDFAQLPKTVTGVNLADNDIYIYKGLATVSDKGFVLQKDLKKLVLPASARFNVDILPNYYDETKGKTTLQMQNPDTQKIEDYTTLRNIPDETVRQYIKKTFPSIMKGEQIDLLADFGKESATDILFRGQADNLEGLQYITNNSRWEGATIMIFSKGTNPKLFCVKPTKTVQLIGIKADTPYLDLSQIEDLRFLWLANNPSIEIVDLTASKRFMQRTSAEQSNQDTRHSIMFSNCPNLTEIKFSKDIKKGALHELALIDLPKLKEFDMSKIDGLSALALGKIPNTQLTLPEELTYNLENDNQIRISITEDMTTNTQVKDFILKCEKEKTKDGESLLSTLTDEIEYYSSDREESTDYYTLWKLWPWLK